MEQKLKIAVFIDFDNIEIGVKSTLHREFDVAAVLDALKERGEIVTKFAYANWGRQESATRALSEHAVQMVQRDPSPRGDKNGADINLALDALEMAFTHDHINAFAIVSGDSDFIALVNKLKQYDKRIFVVGGRAFTSTILQKNCHEFVAYESLIDDRAARWPSRPQRQQAAAAPTADRSRSLNSSRRTASRSNSSRRSSSSSNGRTSAQALDLAQAMPLVERALGVLERREVRPQLGSAEIHHAAARFHLQREGLRSQLVHRFRGEAAEGRLRGGDRRRRPLHDPHEGRRGSPRSPGPSPKRPFRCCATCSRCIAWKWTTARWPKSWPSGCSRIIPNFDWREYGFQEFERTAELTRRTRGWCATRPMRKRASSCTWAPNSIPPAPPPEPEPVMQIEEEEDEPQPLVPGQPTATGEIPIPEPPPKPQRRPRAPRKTSGGDGQPKKRTTRPRKKPTQ